MSKDALLRRIIAGDAIVGLDARPPLDLATSDATERVVAVVGVYPYIELLDQGTATSSLAVGGRCNINADAARRQCDFSGIPHRDIIMGDSAKLTLRRDCRS
jgi:hypothetical protein